MSDHLLLFEAAMDLGSEIQPPTPEPEPAPEPTPEPPPEQPAEPTAPGGPVPEWQQYGFRDPDAMWQAYREAQNYIASTRSQPAQQEPQGPAMPPSGIGTYASQEERDELHQHAVTHGVQGIAQVAQQVLDHRDFYGDEIVNYYVGAWMQTQPLAAMAKLNESAREQWQQQVDQRYAPVLEGHRASIIDGGAEIARASVPDWGQYEQQVVSLIKNDDTVRNQLFACQTAQQAAQYFANIRHFIVARDIAAQMGRQPANGGQPPPDNRERDENGRFKPRTADTSTTARVDDMNDTDRMVELMRQKQNDL